MNNTKDLVRVRSDLIIKIVGCGSASKADLIHLKEVNNTLNRFREGLRLKKVYDVLRSGMPVEFRTEVADAINASTRNVLFSPGFLENVLDITLPFFMIVVPDKISAYSNKFDNSLHLEFCVGECLLTFAQEESNDEWSWIALSPYQTDDPTSARCGPLDDPHYVIFSDILSVYGLDRFSLQLNEVSNES